MSESRANDGEATASALAASIAGRALEVEAKVAVAESLTGGQLCAALAAASDASTWFRGGVVAYSSRVKHELLNVPAGPVVCADAACAMAESVLATHRASYAVALTGVGGPDPQDGRPPGTVYLAVAGPAGTDVEELYLPGDPSQVCRSSVRAGLAALDGALRPARTGAP